MRSHHRTVFLLAASLLAACAPMQPPGPAGGLDRLEHIVVIYAENRSFDHLYGLFPGAEGIAQATAQQKTQLNHDGTPLATLPPVYEGGKPSTRFPSELPNGPFRIDQAPVNRRLDEVLPSPIHNFWQNQEQINGGANNKFVAMTTVGAWTMGYWDGSQMKLWKWAQQYTLADHFFMGAFGGSFLNHQWLVCACTPSFPNAPESMRPQLDEDGRLMKKPNSPPSVLNGPVQVFDGSVTPDGYAVNTSQPAYQPSGAPPAVGGNLDFADLAKNPVPPQTAKTIGDTLSAKGISWAWYAGGWNAALADGRQAPGERRGVIYNGSTPEALAFQPHHQPFNYFARFAPGTADRAEHLKDYDDFAAAIDAGKLPAVSFYKPVGRLTQHPSYTDLAQGDEHIDALLQRLVKSPQWPKMAIIVTYDENGGYWDHVPPPKGDRWGPGTRIPAIVISPFAKKGFVDKTSYDTTSIIKLITRRFALEPLPGARAGAGDLSNAFAF
ncbi:acid phosphatase [Ideonella sp. YS5]|uniref:acid phosphatase n=1 Tax=Ideonella sp. YS5 TaxID=3453714 RepID=UPI003EECFCC6